MENCTVRFKLFGIEIIRMKNTFGLYLHFKHKFLLKK